MPASVKLYDSAYGHYEADVYRQVRIATYGADLGQTSWVTSEESQQIPLDLEIASDSRVLEIGCGSGRYALQVAETTGCAVVGVDLNDSGIRNANNLAQQRKLSARVAFEQCDASKALPFPDHSFHAVFANDVLCHIPNRFGVLQEIHRVLKARGRLLFSDALVIGGIVSHNEIATRSSIGYYLFSPPGYNEQLIRDAGFQILQAHDTTANAASIALRWRDARQANHDQLIQLEGQPTFDGVQQFLSCVHTLCAERRLLRYLYTAQKPS